MTRKTNTVKRNKWAVVDLERCKPEICVSCKAAEACPHHIMEQEAPNEVPMLRSTMACVGCGLCAQACPLHAVYIQHGSETLV